MLKGNELIVFAFINGYSQQGQGCYHGSLAYLQKVCGLASRHTAIDILKSLVEKGLIEKQESLRNGVKYVSYSVCADIAQGVQKLHTGCAENGHNIKDDIDIYSSLSNKRSRFEKPTIEQIREYCQERNNKVSPEAFLSFYESNGWKVGKNPMKDWKASVRTWETRIKQDARTASAPKRKESVYEHNIREMDKLMGTNYHAEIYGKKEEADEQ